MQPFTLHNLPPPHDPFIGRAAIRQEIHTCLDRRKPRCIALLGMSGVGKTRLALQVARERLSRYVHGAWLVSLDEQQMKEGIDGTILAAAIAWVLHLPLKEGADPGEQVIQRLEARHLLLILDSCEQLNPDGMGLLSRLLEHCPGVDLLAATRKALHLPGCRTFVLNGLSYPVEEDPGGPWEAVELFLARWAQRRWTPLSSEERALIHRICRRVEGLPLAIELAAALTSDLSLSDLAAALGEGLEILAISLRDAPVRHRSLRAAFECSWQELSPELRTCLVRLARLERHFSAGAAREEAQVDVQALTALCNHALVIPQTGSGDYRIHAVVRAFTET